MTLPYDMSDEKPLNRLRNNSTELLLRLGEILVKLSELFSVEDPKRAQLLEELKSIEAEMAKVKGVAAFRHSLFYGYNRKPETNQLCIRILALMVYTTLFKETFALNIMHLAQVIVPDATELIAAVESKRLASELVIQGALKIQEQHYVGQGHPITPYVRLNNNVLIQILGGEKCMAVLNPKVVETVRQEREDKMLQTVHSNMELKKAAGLKQRPIQLPPDRLKWMRRSNGENT